MTNRYEKEVIPRVRDFLIRTARRDIGPRLRDVYYQGLEDLKTRSQGSLVVTKKDAETFELTTSADTEIDDQLRNAWQEQFPDIPWYSEESKDSRLKGMEPEELRKLPILLVVDPIDGSGRLARHSDRFSSSFALVVKGKPIMAVVYQPVTDTLWTAEEEREGAFKNDKRIYVSDTTDLDETTVSTAFAWNRQQRRENQKMLNRLVYFVTRVAGTASSVLDGTDVAQGETDAHASIGLKPWDMAGFSLLVKKAGGEVTSFTGEDWTPFQSDILASNGLIHKDLLDVINRNAILDALMKLYQIHIRRDIRNKRPVYKAFNQVKEGIIFLSKRGR